MITLEKRDQGSFLFVLAILPKREPAEAFGGLAFFCHSFFRFRSAIAAAPAISMATVPKPTEDVHPPPSDLSGPVSVSLGMSGGVTSDVMTSDVVTSDVVTSDDPSGSVSSSVSGVGSISGSVADKG